MTLLGLVVFSKAIYRLYQQDIPTYEVMGVVALVALAANALSLVLLTRHKNDDINFSSVWACSRNDIIANISVMAAAAMVSLTGSIWPDVIVGLVITFLFLRTSFDIFTDSRKVLAGQNL